MDAYHQKPELAKRLEAADLLGGLKDIIGRPYILTGEDEIYVGEKITSIIFRPGKLLVGTLDGESCGLLMFDQSKKEWSSTISSI